MSLVQPDVVVLDYGFGNIRSAQRALERAGARVQVSADPAVASAADGLVVPGVGAFAACMRGLQNVGADTVVVDRVRAGAPVLGICVGMQVLFEAGVEHGSRTPGLAILPGTVEPLAAPILPHMGWNTVSVPPESRLFAGVETERFYFVHSYGVRPVDGSGATDTSTLVTTTEYGQSFVAAIERGPLWATQFHPEKSGDAGAVLLANWVRELS